MSDEDKDIELGRSLMQAMKAHNKVKIESQGAKKVAKIIFGAILVLSLIYACLYMSGGL